MSGTRREEIIYDANGNVISDNIYPVMDTETNTNAGTGTSTVPSYVYTPGATAPTNGSAMDYATWLHGSTKYNAEQDSLRQQQAIETQRQKSVIDANNAYKTGLATYGANAEKMASMGLTGSGYGEYLTGKAYATQRADITAANSLAAQRKDEVLYQERTAKDAADQLYAQNMIEIGNQQNTNYGAIYDAVLNGASIDSVMQDARWSTLSPEQQQLITQTANEKVLQGMLDSGKSLDEVKTDSRWATLTPDMQTKLESNYNESVKLETESNLAEFESTFINWLANIKSGALTLDELKNLDAYKKMAADPNGATFITQLEAAQAANDSKLQSSIKESVSDGATLEQIEAEIGANPNKEQIIENVKTDVKNSIEEFLKNPTVITEGENTSIDDQIIENAMKNGYITIEEMQGYYNRLVANTMMKQSSITVTDAIENEKALKELKDAGKLSYNDYVNLTKSMFSKVGESLSTKTERRYPNGVDYLDRKITVNGKTYNLTFDSSKKVDEDTSRILNSITQNTRTDGKTAIVDGVIYTFIVYTGSNAQKTGWYPAKSNPLK